MDDGLACHLGGGEGAEILATPGRFMLQKPGISAGMMAHLAVCRLSMRGLSQLTNLS